MAGDLETLTFESVREDVHEYIAVNFLFESAGAGLDDSASLLERGVVDATGVLELVLFVEEMYGLTVEQEDLIPEHFDSVNSIATYVVRRASEAADRP